MTETVDPSDSNETVNLDNGDLEEGDLNLALNLDTGDIEEVSLVVNLDGDLEETRTALVDGLEDDGDDEDRGLIERLEEIEDRIVPTLTDRLALEEFLDGDIEEETSADE